MSAHGSYVIWLRLSGQYWREPAPGERAGRWCPHRGDATHYARQADADRAASAVRAKFQRHNRSAVQVLGLPANQAAALPRTPDLFAGFA